MIVHCNRKFEPYVIQFLKDNENYSHRSLEIGFCPECNHQIAKLVERRKSDGYKTVMQVSRRKAKRLILECEKDIEYTSLDAPKKAKTLFGFRYGENKERINKDGTKTVVQKACDFYGNKELVRKSITNTNTDQEPL